MKRRSFLTMLGAAGLAPALPSVAVPAGARGVTISLYARAVGHARTRAHVSAKGLAYCLKISAAQAEELMARLTAKGIINTAVGATQASSNVCNSDIWGFDHAASVPGNGPANTQTQTANTSADFGKPKIRSNPMDKFTTLTGIAAPMPLVNIDTDMIIPKQFLKTIKRSGLGVNLFDEMRYDREGNEIADFVLNKPQYRNAEILVAGDNFGCGSSREHAPWAIKDFGIRCVIAPSFADIFFNNCFKNGILPIALPQEQVDVLMNDAEKGENARMTIDLDAQTITTSDGEVFGFDVDPFKKHCLMNGLDDIGLTMEKSEAINSFESNAAQTRPWV